TVPPDAGTIVMERALVVVVEGAIFVAVVPHETMLAALPPWSVPRGWSRACASGGNLPNTSTPTRSTNTAANWRRVIWSPRQHAGRSTREHVLRLRLRLPLRRLHAAPGVLLGLRRGVCLERLGIRRSERLSGLQAHHVARLLEHGGGVAEHRDRELRVRLEARLHPCGDLFDLGPHGALGRCLHGAQPLPVSSGESGACRVCEASGSELSFSLRLLLAVLVATARVLETHGHAREVRALEGNVVHVALSLARPTRLDGAREERLRELQGELGSLLEHGRERPVRAREFQGVDLL